ncbi:MAG: hypothetical protein A2431_03710 [Candidatus Zambryskibacteria bacterium RIFOXYC1_FULL_39_10]|uniref:Uncharacterized protein n=1 Tax=Candidatus Zambryskibacteria bacterium RIFOXYC1_FULL_39_10 TaxID=1802779 RepID=A0A1G2V2V9_9BACT|nr:MAG: hypothetical protein A2431_03710 [Candidatus Zambryskibacteria bacterium RIFOXYC1_FULL_39_10]OHB16640.1 MAG: hypothetical protein A2605_00565 [Candidatus Zambryskibacteria bacterium RIFOXYD1_FULL_39_35]
MPFDRNSKEAQEYIPPRLSQKQIEAIEYLITKSKDATQFAKKVVIWFLRQTDGMTKSVALSVPEQFLGEEASQIEDSVHDMNSVSGSTHIDSVFQAAGTEMRLQHHRGTFFDGEFNGGRGRTIWCSWEWYSRNVSVLPPPTNEDLAKIDLHKITHPWEK